MSCESTSKNQSPSDSRYRTLTSADLRGKTFEGKLHPKTSVHQENKTLEKIGDQARIKYQFKGNNEVSYRIDLESMANELVFSWHLDGDSLTFEQSKNGQAQRIQYLIRRSINGFTLENDEYFIYLMEN
ncbi:hypothetical protein [Spirosoma fluviale]|uniref:Uncharacterized protein n=1 Tax=Spirosoma fluviale TaxID=1597977 RepID=A0A286GAM3_9BACT|nr:hypothetical protein [Spirosoma fluviale]SOD92542.1 hypothetical protein SAMN06269250_4032 [Spirosoma fluviale]